MVERTATFSGWNPDQTLKAALFRLRGEAGELIDQLTAEKKINNWEDVQRSLKERFQGEGKEIWYRHLLHSSYQEGKTVQEWAQLVRKLSVQALGENPFKTEASEGEDQAAVAAVKTEARRCMLDYMRLTNFIRGLRKNLRIAVLRKKCPDFDSAVAVATDEETLEITTREEEALTGFPRIRGTGLAGPYQPLIDGLVAALEAREETKSKWPPTSPTSLQSGPEKAASAGYEKRVSSATRRARDSQENRGRSGREVQPHLPPRPERYDNWEEEDNGKYNEQIPLPRQERRQEPHVRTWVPDRAKPRKNRLSWYEQLIPTEQEDFNEGRCFKCHKKGHRRAQCFTKNQSSSGDARRRI